MASVEVRGAEQLADLGKRLKDADATELRQDLRRNLRNAVKPAKPFVQESLRQGLPQRGGLAALMGKASVGARVRTEGSQVGVRVIVQKGKSVLSALDRGVLRHPVFGRGKWVTQQVEPGLISKPMDRMKPLVRRSVLEAMEKTSRRITS